MTRVDYYKFPDGSNPIDPYLNSLDIKMRAKVLRTVELLETFGTQLRLPHSRHLEDGIFELRIKQGTNIERVLYFFFLDNRAILTNGFSKKTRQTPRKELDLAKKRRADYLSRRK